MNKRHQRSLPRLAVLVLTVVLAAAWGAAPGAALAQAGEPVKFRVPITDEGWPANFAVNVEEGRTVEITFTWDQRIHTGDAHVFVLEGYNVESSELNATNREVTLRFVASKAGTFRLKCDLECEIHDQLKNANVVVSRAGTLPTGGGSTGPAAADARPKTNLLLGAPLEGKVGAIAPLTASLKGANGAPLANVPVVLFETAAFYDVAAQEVEVASAVTDKDGAAVLPYLGRRVGPRELKVYFAGDIDHAPASVALKLDVVAGGQVYTVEPPAGIPGVSRFLVSGVLIVIWGTMFIVSLHVIAILRSGGPEEARRD